MILLKNVSHLAGGGKTFTPYTYMRGKNFGGVLCAIYGDLTHIIGCDHGFGLLQNAGKYSVIFIWKKNPTDMFIVQSSYDKPCDLSCAEYSVR